ncbi:MAG: hypothetical protein ACPGF7_06765 [Pontibacterium sp.]
MSEALIIAAAKITDGTGSLTPVQGKLAQLSTLGITATELLIDPLKTDWHSPLQENHFRSGCAPVEALYQARTLIREGGDAVVIRGKDLIKSDYSRDERHHLMAVYGEQTPITDAYNDLAQYFLQKHKINSARFRDLSAKLFENYQRSYRKTDAATTASDTPPARWFEQITPLFRGVDCANPLIDFEAELLICREEIANQLQVPDTERVAIRGVGLGFLEQDGPSAIRRIARYTHLQNAFQHCNAEAQLDFNNRFLNGEALLETYTCYPVVPMAFLLASGLVDQLEAIPAFLEKHLITITGGMNLARAPWNNPALNGLICMYQQLTTGDITVGAVHGNGGLGYRQGVAMLERLT